MVESLLEAQAPLQQRHNVVVAVVVVSRLISFVVWRDNHTS